MANNVYFIIPENMSLVYSTPRPSKCLYIVWFTVCLKIDFSFPLLLFWMIFDAQTRLHWIRWRRIPSEPQPVSLRTTRKLIIMATWNVSIGRTWLTAWTGSPKKNVICHFSVRFELGKLRRNEWVSRAMLTELFTPGSFHFYWKCYAFSGFEFQAILDSVSIDQKKCLMKKYWRLKSQVK